MQFKQRFRQVLTIKESPQKIAVSFAIGVFLGMSPFLGIHTLLGIIFAWLFSLNRVATLIGVYVTNPWTIIPIYTFGTWVGAQFMKIDSIIPEINWNDITCLGLIDEFRQLILPFFIGTIFIGIISAVISYFIVYKTVRINRG